MDKRDFDQFYNAYVECALWASMDDDDKPLDSLMYSEAELAPETVEKMRGECMDFLAAYGELITVENFTPRGAQREYSAMEIAGHDFWLTRNGHGSGFWDGAWREPAATKLTEASHAAGERHLYAQDGQIYQEMG